MTMRLKILTAFFVLAITMPQIYTPAYADKAQDKASFSAVLTGNVDEAKPTTMRIIDPGSVI